MILKKNKGITLVALVITIVVLLILAGISISALTNTGIFQKAKDAKQKSENAQKEEKSLLSEYEKEILKQDSNSTWDGNVNKPELMSGMKAANFEFNEQKDEYEVNTKDINVNNENNEWYNYDSKKWANAQTEDGSMWVWIPRYAYKVVYNDPNDKSKGGVFDIVFLIGTTDNYIDENGNIQTAQRQTSKDQTIITDSTKTDKYTVHPAFTNESSIDYANGGWRKELTGIWVSKFEAGYAGGNNYADEVESKIKYSQSQVWASLLETGSSDGPLQARNFYEQDGYDNTKTFIKYPTFQGLTYSINYINHNDAFSISKALTDDGNIYHLNSKETDSHLIKNSEWGAVAYLGQSKYGLNDQNIRINNFTLNNKEKTIYAVTGYAAKNEDASLKDSTSDVNKWTEKNGTVASCTGTIYGIYDMSGGAWERSAAIVNNGNSKLNEYGSSIMKALNNGKSTEYVTVYDTDTNKDNTSISENNINLNIANVANYEKNTKYGDAIRETSTAGEGHNAWNTDYSCFAGLHAPFFIRGGTSENSIVAGLFSFTRNGGDSVYYAGFRSVLVVNV